MPTNPRLWLEACQYEGIAPESVIVVWSHDNPYAREYNYRMGRLLDGRNARAS